MTNLSNGKEDHTGVICQIDVTVFDSSSRDAFCNEMVAVEERAKGMSEKVILAAGRILPKVIEYLRYYGFECHRVGGDPECFYCSYRIDD